MEINHEAPASASAETLIRAPLDLVWSVQSDISRWSQWHPDVSRVQVSGPIAPGTEFRWKAGGMTIVSRLEEVEPRRRLAWTGRTLGTRAVHVWRFSETDGGVQVRTEESLEGLIVRLFPGPMRRTLNSALERGVAALRAECERRLREAPRRERPRG